MRSELPIPNVQSMAATWARRILQALNLRQAVRVTHEGSETVVRIEDEIPHLSARGERPLCYRITHRGLLLRASEFPNATVRHNITRRAGKPRGRTIFCEHRASQRVLAAASFHIDPARQHPLLLIDLAVTQRSPQEAARGEFAAHMLFGYLFEVARQDGRAVELGFVPRNPAERALAERLGFQPCPRPAALSVPGVYLCRRPRGDRSSPASSSPASSSPGR